MAEIVNDYNFARTKRSSYPWKDYFNGKVWKLTKGVDFHCMPEAFRAAAYQAAIRHGVRVRTHVPSPNTIVIQAYKPESES